MSLTGNFIEDDANMEELNTGSSMSKAEARRKVHISRTMHYGGLVVSDDEYHEALRILGEE